MPKHTKAAAKKIKAGFTRSTSEKFKEAMRSLFEGAMEDKKDKSKSS